MFIVLNNKNVKERGEHTSFVWCGKINDQYTDHHCYTCKHRECNERLDYEIQYWPEEMFSNKEQYPEKRWLTESPKKVPEKSTSAQMRPKSQKKDKIFGTTF